MTYLFEMLKQVMRQKRHLRLSKAEVTQLQRQKFLQLVQYAAKNSPYYAKIIHDNHVDITNCTPEDFPVLTKAELIKHFDDIVTDRRITSAAINDFLSQSKDPNQLFLGRYIVIHTSGSSGTVGVYVYSVPEFLTGLAPNALISGVHLLQKVAFVAATRDHFAGATMASAGHRLWPLYQDVRLLDINAPFDQTINALNDQQPHMVSGYAFALRKLAEAQVAGKLHIKPISLQPGGEPLSAADKNYIQQAFGAPVANIYASSEHIIMGIGRDSFGGIYLMDDNLIFELGESEIRVTNLYNYTLPLIRYQMADQLQPLADPSPQMPFTKILDVIGRQESVPIFTNDHGAEDFISPHLLAEVWAKGLAQFQIHLTGPKSFVFRARFDDNLAAAQKQAVVQVIEAQLRAILKEKFMTTVGFQIEETAQLWADQKTGKFAFIVPR